jgi:DNA-binding beta-propeller fold protein YncE
VGLKHLGYVDLPHHVGRGGFDHAAVDRGRALLYVAHTANDAVDVIDTRSGTYLRSVAGLKGVAGALVDQSTGRVFSSNRAENSVGLFSADAGERVVKVPAGQRPNGLAYDPGRGILLCANVGDPDVAGSASATLIDVRARSVLAEVPMPGRTRWAIFDPSLEVFFVNVADPARIAILDPRKPDRIAGQIHVPARGPHGLDLDRSRRRLYCACDQGRVVGLDARSGETLGSVELSGAPDVIFLNLARSRLYVAIGDPGVVEVIDVASWERAEVVATERGAHTIAFDEGEQRVYAFLPETHRASVFADA